MERSYKYDNIKALLIFFVVLGHMLRPTVTSIMSSSFMYFFIYLFHMPAFVYIMGKFTKPSLKRIRLFLLLYFPFQIIYYLFFKYILNDIEYSVFSLIEPIWILWYLPVAAVFTGATFILPKEISKTKKIILIVGACILALLVGFIMFIDMRFTLSRIFVFFPFFLAGRYDIFSEKASVGKCAFWCLISLSLVIFYILNNSLNINVLHQKYPYAFTYSDWTDRAVALITAFCFIKFLILVIPNKKIPIISDVGRYTLFIFLLHGFLVKLLLYYYIPTHPVLFGLFCSVGIVFLLWLCSIGFKRLRSSIQTKRLINQEACNEV